MLLADLKRHYEFAGMPEREPTCIGLLMHTFDARFVPVILCRLANALYKVRLRIPARLVSIVNFVFFGIEIAMRCDIGPGLCFPHTIGTVIGAQRIGRNAVIYHGVTLGAKEMDVGYSSDARPLIGDNVVIGSGAKVLGGITIGNNVIIGANAVVTHDAPDNAVIGGVPGKILHYISD